MNLAKDPQTRYPRWNDWKWQFANRITNAEGLSKVLPLEEAARFMKEAINKSYRAKGENVCVMWQKFVKITGNGFKIPFLNVWLIRDSGVR